MKKLLWCLPVLLLLSLQSRADRPAWVSELAFAPDSKSIAAGYEDGTLSVWSNPAGKRKPLPGHTDRVEGVAVRGNGEIVSWSRDDTVAVTSVSTGRQRKWKAAGKSQVGQGALAPDGTILATWGIGPVLLWDLETGKARPLDVQPSSVTQGHFSPDGKWFAIGVDHCALVYDVASAQRKLKVELGMDFRDLAFTPEGHLLALIDICLREFEVPSGKLLHQDSVSFDNWTLAVRVSPSGKRKFVLGENRDERALLFGDAPAPVKVDRRVIGFAGDDLLVELPREGGYGNLLHASDGTISKRFLTPGTKDSMVGIPEGLAEISPDGQTLARAAGEAVKTFSLR